MGAPEALVIGVVALLVFGPKGLADIAKQLGQTLRAFQPTIRELQEVSREFKETLEDEIGLDEIRNDIAQVAAPVPTKRQAPPPGTTTTPEASATGPTDQSTDTVTEEMRAAAAAAAWGGDEPVAVAGPDDVATDADAKETAATAAMFPESSPRRRVPAPRRPQGRRASRRDERERGDGGGAGMRPPVVRLSIIH